MPRFLLVDLYARAARRGVQTSRRDLYNKLKRFGMLLYCGDDLTDEVAFQRLNKKGITILVADTPWPTAASFFLRNPNEVYEFLQRLIRLKGTKSC